MTETIRFFILELQGNKTFLSGGGILNKKRNKMIEFRSNQSRKVVARLLKITPQMLGAIERGDRTPSLELAKRIADFYKTTIDDLFFS